MQLVCLLFQGHGERPAILAVWEGRYAVFGGSSTALCPFPFSRSHRAHMLSPPSPSPAWTQVLDRTERLASSTFRLGTDTQKIFGQSLGGYPDRGGNRGGDGGGRGKGGGIEGERQPSLRAQALRDGPGAEREERGGGEEGDEEAVCEEVGGQVGRGREGGGL